MSNETYVRAFIEVEPDVFRSTEGLSPEELDAAERLARERGNLNELRDIRKVRESRSND